MSVLICEECISVKSSLPLCLLVGQTVSSHRWQRAEDRQLCSQRQRLHLWRDPARDEASQGVSSSVRKSRCLQESGTRAARPTIASNPQPIHPLVSVASLLEMFKCGIYLKALPLQLNQGKMCVWRGAQIINQQLYSAEDYHQRIRRLLCPKLLL